MRPNAKHIEHPPRAWRNPVAFVLFFTSLVCLFLVPITCGADFVGTCQTTSTLVCTVLPLVTVVSSASCAAESPQDSSRQKLHVAEIYLYSLAGVDSRRGGSGAILGHDGSNGDNDLGLQRR